MPKKSIIIQLAKLQAILVGFIGLLLGVIYSFGGLIIDILVSLDWYQSCETPGLSRGSIFAFGALVAMPLLFGITGFVIGLVQGLIITVFIKIAPRSKIALFLNKFLS